MNKKDQQRLLREVDRLEPYPAVFVPQRGGGFEVVFPNLAQVRAFGPDKDQAETAAREMLTAELGRMLQSSEEPPRPSDPERLVAGDDEPPGTYMIMVSADRKTLKSRLGLEKRERGLDLGLGRLGRQ
ncbi:MAG: hypothetical protein KQJ78_10395 [Deltaproteobacteria bacterium]|nr:hypothetical protein [Deltaproteobacteria bacterium]